MISKVATAAQISRLVYRFCTYPSSTSIDQVRNSNLKFDTPQWTVNLYPFYPQIFKKKGKNIYEISNNSVVLAMTFINKVVVRDS